MKDKKYELVEYKTEPTKPCEKCGKADDCLCNECPDCHKPARKVAFEAVGVCDTCAEAAYESY